MRRTYNRFPRDPQKKKALEAWAQHVESIVAGKPTRSNVVSLREAVE